MSNPTPDGKLADSDAPQDAGHAELSSEQPDGTKETDGAHSKIEESDLGDRRSSSRARKAVQPVNISSTSVPKAVDTLPEGNGVPLGEIEPVKQALSKHLGSSDTLQGLHRVLYGARSKNNEVKAHLRAWKGFAEFSTTEEEEKRKSKFDTWKMDGLKEVAEILQLPHSGSKEDQINRIWEFLKKPAQVKARGAGKAKTSAKKRASGVKSQRKKKDESEEDDESASEKDELEEDAKGGSDSDDDPDDYEEEDKPRKRKKSQSIKPTSQKEQKESSAGRKKRAVRNSDGEESDASGKGRKRIKSKTLSAERIVDSDEEVEDTKSK
ncbi:hypothetical protein M427DRAFT_54164 [Gonapodya prolifera JEL478]|uniref:SAP domain-containing protein n=1 Tax=Gonapodya prolifera (strain JEL478) TaxID=1344416 RepID=A0A139AN21_GONPJ|nr:hypothetical protein M427DRAFT_54164 [Gonapodya prolifera JEL478]|eukprot:KXS17933.1 hypothetical protein M427DRAFT_54164 [Gonapodya prolifera JEL478]